MTVIQRSHCRCLSRYPTDVRSKLQYVTIITIFVNQQNKTNFHKKSKRCEIMKDECCKGPFTLLHSPQFMGNNRCYGSDTCRQGGLGSVHTDQDPDRELNRECYHGFQWYRTDNSKEWVGHQLTPRPFTSIVNFSVSVFVSVNEHHAIRNFCES